eukprot:Rmarinus@m.1196
MGAKGKKGKKGGKGKKKDAKTPAEQPEIVLRKLRRTYEAHCKDLNVPMLPAFTQTIAAHVEDSKFFTQLIIAERTLGPVGAKALMTALAQYSHLKTLCFWKSNTQDEGAMAIADVLKSNCTLANLELMDDHITEFGCKSLANVLKANETLYLLSLDHNTFGCAGARALGDGLKWNTGLLTLSLAYCQIGEEGAKAIAQDIISYSKVKNLNLQGNPLGPNGVITIASALAGNTTIESITLADTQFGHSKDAIEALAVCFQANVTLKEVDLNMNSIGTEGGQRFIEALKDKTNYTYFAVTERMDKAVFDQINAMVDKNQPKGKKGKKGGKKKK